MATISGLSVRVSSATAQFRAGMSRAEDAAGDLALSLNRLSFASERADDNLDEVGRSALGASGGMLAFGASTEGAGFSVRGLSGSILVSLVPALGVLAGALTPLVVALGGFVAVAGSIGGIGLVGTLGAIATHTEELKARFMEVVGTFKDEFMPVFDTAAEVLFTFMDAFEDVIPALVPAQDVISELGGNFAQLGVTIIDALPAFVDLATTLALEFLPPFVTFVQDVLPRVPDMIQHMGNVFGRVLPTLMDFGRAVADIYPDLLAFGFVALDAVADSLGFLGGILAQTLSAFNDLDSGLQGLLARAALVAPVVLAIGSLLGGISAPIIAVIGLVAGLAQAWRTNFGGIRETVSRAGAELRRVLGENLPILIENTKQIINTLLPIVEPIFSALAGFIGVVFVNAIDASVSALTALSQILTGDVQGALTTIEGVFGRVINRAAEFINKLTGGALQAFVNRVIEVVNTLGSVAERTASALGQDFEFTAIEQVELGTTPFQSDQTMQRPPRVAPGQSGIAGAPAEVQVTVEGDTDVVRDVAVETIDEQQRTTRRRQGRITQG